MASSSTTTGVSSGRQQLLKKAKKSDESKLKRMASNRESAKRSRIRKQKHLNEVTTQISQLKSKNNLILTNISVINELHVTVEAENSVLKGKLGELSQRLESLNQIMDCSLNSNNDVMATNDGDGLMFADDLMDLWNVVQFGQPIEASAEMFM
ncbi:Basic-leucine zipper domain-containing protein [Heracleum sosnowskyi]|uniref:Basic-leucine zipper domain-containing protein n=1 Tax=Heracleum sosnowskyi TaxID=360622 RepID=A0AAD8H2M1_9APIA|nr:Basic-leucine zipper domain-containing protein [Heracleum sosnowskyi]